jgi:hypothetical protein
MAKVVISIIGMLCAAWAVYSYVTARLDTHDGDDK